ncbi:MAG: hypothetical protein K2I06_09425 [Ruminococcus sp.]|nr:hypothetical protein [Ruminococcus sp.]
MGFIKKNKKDTAVYVSTKQELRFACNRGEKNIVVKEPLAHKLAKLEKLSKVSKKSKRAVITALTLSGTALVATSLTGGTSNIMGIVGVVPAVTAVSTELSIETAQAVSMIILAVSFGATLIIAVLKDYTIEVSPDKTVRLTKN